MSKDDDRKRVLELIVIGLGLSHAAFAKQVLGISGPRWSTIYNGKKLPLHLRQKIVETYRLRFKSFAFESTHLDVPPRDFVALFRKEKIYDDLRKELKPEEQPDEVPPPHPLERFFGCFVGFYPCRESDDTSRNAIGYDIFEISPKPNSYVEAKLLQSPLDFDNSEANGVLRVIRDTVEIVVEYNNEKDPNTCYLAPSPRAEVVNSLLASCLDITYPDRLVSTRSTLFVRVDKRRLPKNPKDTVVMFGQDSEVYQFIRPILEGSSNYSAKTLQLLLRDQIEIDAENLIKKAMEAFWRDLKIPPSA